MDVLIIIAVTVFLVGIGIGLIIAHYCVTDDHDEHEDFPG